MLPSPGLLAHVASLAGSSTAAVTHGPAVPLAPPTNLSWSVAAPGVGENTLASQLVLLLQAGASQQASAERVVIGPGFPTVPKKLLDRMIWWEFVDLAELLPQSSAHNAATPEVDPHRFMLFLGCEFIKPKKRQINSISDWVRAFTVYVAAMAAKFPEAVRELLAYQLAVMRASDQYDSLYWRAYDTLPGDCCGHRE